MRFTGLVVWLTLGASLASGSIGAGLVLCVGPNDHLAFEIKKAEVECAGCEGAGANEPGESHRIDPAQADCPCIDVALGSDSIVSRSESLKRWAIEFPLEKALGFRVSDAVVDRERVRRARYALPPPAASPLSHLRTVVLLV